MSVRILHTKGDGVLNSTTPEDVSDIADAIMNSDHSVLHVHGGLISEGKGFDKAYRLDGFYRQNNILPIFPVWETGMWEAVRNNWREIFDEQIFRVLLMRVLKYAGGKILAAPGRRSRERINPLSDREVAVAVEDAWESEVNHSIRIPLDAMRPMAEVDELSDDESQQFAGELATSRDLQEAVDAIMLGLQILPPETTRNLSATIPPTTTHISDDILDEMRTTAGPSARGIFSTVTVIRHAVKILARVIRRFRQRTDHGLYTTVVEEILREFYISAIGRWVWERMKLDAAQTFEPAPSGSTPRGGALLWQEIAQRLKSGSAMPKLSIVAHSAGAIWTCHFLEHMKTLRDSGSLPSATKVHQIFFLAPACRLDLFTRTIEMQRAGGLFDQLRLMGLQDNLEAGYWEVPLLYPRSLLYLVSGLFEGSEVTPLLGMQRYHDWTQTYSGPQFDSVRTFFKASNRPVWSVIDEAPGRASDAIRHGGFDETSGSARTMKSVLHNLAQNS